MTSFPFAMIRYRTCSECLYATTMTCLLHWSHYYARLSQQYRARNQSISTNCVTVFLFPRISYSIAVQTFVLFYQFVVIVAGARYVFHRCSASTQYGRRRRFHLLCKSSQSTLSNRLLPSRWVSCTFKPTKHPPSFVFSSSPKPYVCIHFLHVDASVLWHLRRFLLAQPSKTVRLLQTAWRHAWALPHWMVNKQIWCAWGHFFWVCSF